MRAAEDKYGDDLVILFVDQQETVADVDTFATRYGLNSLFVMDDSGEVAQTYRMFSTPTTYFISPTGVIQSIQAGVITLDWIDNNLRAGS